MCSIYLYAAAKSKIQICSNKHETCLIHLDLIITSSILCFMFSFSLFFMFSNIFKSSSLTVFKFSEIYLSSCDISSSSSFSCSVFSLFV